MSLAANSFALAVSVSIACIVAVADVVTPVARNESPYHQEHREDSNPGKTKNFNFRHVSLVLLWQEVRKPNTPIRRNFEAPGASP